MATRVCVTVFMLLVGFASGAVSAQDPSRYPLMAIEQHRASVVKAIVDRWAEAFAVLPNGEQRSAEQLGNELWTLRSDRLLAASLAGTFVTVADLLDQSRQEAGGSLVKPAAKALGDTADDLTFTPLTPCRIVDTRNAGGALSPSVTRTLNGFAMSSFASQGGAASTCGIPFGVAALALNVAAVQPAAAGFITLWPANASRPAASTVNYAAGAFATATGTVVPVNAGNNNQFAAWSPAGVDMVVDVVGYFRSPAATALDCVSTTNVTTPLAAGDSGFADSPACTSGYTMVSGNCFMTGNGSVAASLLTVNVWRCWGNALANVADGVRASGNCCRIPGH